MYLYIHWHSSHTSLPCGAHPRLVPNIINMQVSLRALLKFVTTVNLLLVFATYWEHGTGHINAEHGREMVKSSLSLAVPSSDYVHMVKGKAIQQQWMTTIQVLVTLWQVPAWKKNKTESHYYKLWFGHNHLNGRSRNFVFFGTNTVWWVIGSALLVEWCKWYFHSPTS